MTVLLTVELSWTGQIHQAQIQLWALWEALCGWLDAASFS